VKPDTSYFGPVYPEAPNFRDPQDDLLKIGLTRVSGLGKTRSTREGQVWHKQLVEEL